jgi:TfoX/Sxy family transcriptional regulator of competence genes
MAVSCFACLLIHQTEAGMSPAKKSSIPADKSELYDKLIATHPKIERKGASMGYTSLNGHMFTLLGPSGKLAIRLPEAEREKFLRRHNTTLYEAYGAVMKEYVEVPEALFKHTKELQKYLAISYDYIATLKPKPTRKKR